MKALPSPKSIEKQLRQPLPENATDLDIIKNALVCGRDIPKKLQKRFDEYLFIQGLMMQGHTQTHIRNTFVQVYDVRFAIAYKRIQEAKELLGDTNATSREVYRIILTERLQTMALAARASQDLELELAIYAQITKVNGLQHLDAPGVIDPKALELPKMQFEFNFASPPTKRINIEDAQTDEEE